MRPEADTLQVNAYVDGELDLQAQLRFEERLAGEPELRAQVEALRAQSRLLRDGADYHRAPADLRAHFARPAASAAGTAAPARPGRFAGLLAQLNPRKVLVPSLALAALVAVAIDVGVLHLQDARRQQEELVASHVRAVLSQRAVDVASSDQHTVKPWFSTQLDFSPPVRELELPDTVLLGGRVDYVQGRRVAVLVYRYRKHVVDHYMWPAEGPDSGVEVGELRGFKLAQWRQGGLAHRVVSDMNGPELQALVSAARAAARS